MRKQTKEFQIENSQEMLHQKSDKSKRTTKRGSEPLNLGKEQQQAVKVGASTIVWLSPAPVGENVLIISHKEHMAEIWM